MFINVGKVTSQTPQGRIHRPRRLCPCAPGPACLWVGLLCDLGYTFAWCSGAPGVMWVGLGANLGFQMFLSPIWFLKGQRVDHFNASHCFPLRFTVPRWAPGGSMFTAHAIHFRSHQSKWLQQPRGESRKISPWWKSGHGAKTVVPIMISVPSTRGFANSLLDNI